MKFRRWRIAAVVGAILLAALGSYGIWNPGTDVADGRHDRGRNGIWLQHGWLGDDRWFDVNAKDRTRFRADEKIDALARLLEEQGITYVFPHLCPASGTGHIPAVDQVQTERFLKRFANFKVLPWIGGVLDGNCQIDSPKWRAEFCRSIAELLQQFPSLAGIHLNIEPLPSGNADYLKLLEELRKAMPTGKILSVAAYPPPTKWHPFPEVHWDRAYYGEVARRCDQIVPMMYDTSIRLEKVYCHLMSDWTKEVIDWSAPTEVLLGVPTYEDEGVGYHLSKVENLSNALRGIHSGLESYRELPKNYDGVALYSEWVTSPEEWADFKKAFRATR